MPRYRGITEGERIGRVTVRLDGRFVDADGLWHDRPWRADAVHRPAGVLRPATPVRDGQRGLPGQSGAIHVPDARRARVGCGFRADVRHRPRTRLAGRPGARAARHEFRATRSFRRAATVFTIHNLAYQGVFDVSWAATAGPRPGADEDRCPGILGADEPAQGRHRVQPAHHDRQPPVRPGNPDAGIRLRASTACSGSASGDLIGILNGIDYDQWDPCRDPFLPVPYDASHLEGKSAAKRAVLEAFGLPTREGERRRPLVGMISRLVDQKGFDLVAELADTLPTLDASFVLLGTGEERYERLWQELARLLSGSDCRAHRLRRSARAPDRGRRGPVSDAFTLRTLWTEPDVQPSVRHGTGRACDGRTVRHGSQLRRLDRRRHRLYVRDLFVGGASRDAAACVARLRGPACLASGSRSPGWVRIFRGTRRPGST